MSERIVLTRRLEMQRGGSNNNNATPVWTMVMKNDSGGSVARGDVVVLKKTSASTADLLAFTTTTTANDPDAFGIVFDATIANAGLGRIHVWGVTDALKVDGTSDIAIGDFIGAFTTAKIGAKTSGQGAFAMALEAYSTNDSSGVIDAFINGLGKIGIGSAVPSIGYFGDGAVGAPSVTFNSDPDTGLYRIGANNLGVAANGAKVLDVGTAGLGVTGTITPSGNIVMGANVDITMTGTTGTNEIVLTNGLADALSITDGSADVIVVDTSTAGNVLTVTAASTHSGVITPTGGVAAAGGFTARPSNIHTGGIPAQVSTDGTDATPSVSETYYAAVFVPCNMTITGVRVFLGSATNGNIKVGLFDSAGAVLATSASTDASGATVDAYFQVAFTATYAAVGPATYYVGLLNDDTSNRFNAHAFGAFPAGKTTGETYATGFTTIASPATTFTADLGPIATLY